MSVVKQIPKTENGYGVEYTTLSGNVYFISNNLTKKKFTLWKKVDNGYDKMGTADNPLDLYKKCK